MFDNRIDAGRQLAYALDNFKNEDVVVLAIPRGGVPLGNMVAKALNAPLDVALTKKIGHPSNKEYAIGAVSLEDVVITNADGVTRTYIDSEIKRIREKLEKRHNQYYKTKSPENLNNKTVLIVDDGIATGNTIMITIKLVKKQNPKKVIVAVPVASKSALSRLRSSQDIDEVICLMAPTYFRGVGQFYEEFNQVSDEEAIQLLEENYVNGI
ncbi:phosphoribosyltransferase [Flagellimonas meridianipacifica]|uniref:Putative phosphoribosyltransferase n=1 Tax=Flagellimonas meridianipacifica TaxID=1080225 RepID=A0A2T0MAV7_9FLAO|nr:phosphoribosyltransferase family protein [Allomuricauda pacifica]PRX54638.1 putative phosphoribosyltransferase [Allomuricauda pacifica]